MKLDEGWKGSVNFRTREILLDPAQSKNQREFSLLHEVIHIIDNAFECDLDEKNISRIAEGFQVFLQDNLGLEFDWSDIKEE